MAIGILLIPVLLGLLLIRPVWAFGLLAAVLPWDRITALTVGGLPFTASKLLGFILILVWARAALSTPGRHAHYCRPLVLAIASFGLLTVAGILASDLAVQVTALSTLSLLLIPVIFVDCTENLGQVETVWLCFACSMLFSSGLALVQETTGMDPLGLVALKTHYYAPDVYTFRPGGTFDDPNYFALASTAAFCVWISRLVFARSVLARLLYGLALLLTIAGLVVSLSRGGFLGAAVALVVLLVRFRARTSLVLTAAIGVLALLIFSALPLGQILLTRFGTLGDMGTGRLQIWSDYLSIIAAKPLFGVGIGQSAQASTNWGHNILLSVGAERGIPAMLAMVTILTITGLLVFTRHSDDSSARRFSLMLQPLFGAYLVQSLLLKTENEKLLWLIIGSALALAFYCRTDGQRPEQSQRVGSSAPQTVTQSDRLGAIQSTKVSR
jgi:O-antigen ligase